MNIELYERIVWECVADVNGRVVLGYH